VNVLVFFGSLYDTSDDLGYKCITEGIVFTQKPSTYLVFVKSALAELVIRIPSLQCLGIYKYDIFQFSIIFFSLAYLIFKTFKRRIQGYPQWALVLLSALVIFPLIVRPQNTNTAGLVAIISSILIAEQIRTPDNRKLLMLAITIFLGYSLRREMYVVVMAVASPILVLPNFKFEASKWLRVVLVFILVVGLIEFYENLTIQKNRRAYHSAQAHARMIKIFDYGYTKKLRKPSNQDVFKSSGLSENDLDLVSNRFYWHNIDTVLPKVESAINEITARQDKSSRLTTVKYSFQFLFTKELLAYSLSLIFLMVYAAWNIPFKQFWPYLLSLALFLSVVFIYGWIQRYSLTRLFYAPLISLIVLILYQTWNFKASAWIHSVLLVLFSINTVSALQVHQDRMIDAKEMSLMVHKANMKYDSLVSFGGKINFEYLYPPYPLKGVPSPPKTLMTSPISAMTRLNQGSLEVFLTDSSSLNRLNIFSQEHYNKSLNYRMINSELGIYEVSMNSSATYK
jgi:hypothetical protein